MSLVSNRSEHLNTRNECKLGPHIIVQVLDFLGDFDLIEKAILKPFGEAGLQKLQMMIMMVFYQIKSRLTVLDQRSRVDGDGAENLVTDLITVGCT